MASNNLLKFKLFIICLFLFTQSILAQTLERREIQPPKLDCDNLAKRVLCHRPMRHGSPAMNISNKDTKIIINNYGHGGAGWTLAPGAANYVINLALTDNIINLQAQQTPIAVIGAGAIGLFTALDLVNRGFVNITIYADQFEDLTSHKAGGLLAPVSMDDSPEVQKTIDAIAIDAYKFYKKIALKQNAQIQNGAKIMPAYFATRQESELEMYVGKVMNPAKDVLVDFKNGTTHKMVVYDDGIFIETEDLMHTITNILKKSKIKFVNKKVTNFDELSQNIIFNCAGYGAKKLSEDDQMISVQGHLIMLKQQVPEDLNYMMLVFFEKDKTKYNQSIKRSFYIFPKKTLGSKPDEIGVIGGTFIENADATTPNIEEFDILLQGAKKFYGLQQ